MKPTEKGLRPEKIAEANEIDARISGALYMILADYNGMDMPSTNELKNSLRENGAAYNVVKNRMLNRALPEDASALLKGQTAMIYGDGDVVEVAKVIKKFTAAKKKPVIKGGFVEGKAISAKDVVELAKLPPKDVMRAMLLGTLQAPCSQLVGVMDQKIASLVYVLSAAKDKKEQEA
ncbi:50S ribosomal protein L10 [Pontiella desulfatans]|uniref:Large ribosomal subunit protein uL10 n=1 Tax=Pontiella desulfatans TaxID=2750659 RepID=A0A6C2U598_PONDE|nr:50S ribosomal protein L10 [Pontiella desulfatans]VGO14674.1 50S ribosomal protein L10 [Pontiella desulfatans]